MGESACLMQHSFSYSTQLRDPLSESISFGRFTTDSDSLTWDKWSNLSHKRYVEEAAKYSQPGSVAQKKAFFEAYYKKKALLAQENAAAAAVAQATATLDQQSDHDSIDDTPVSTAENDLVNVVEKQNEGNIVSEFSTEDPSATDVPAPQQPQEDVFAEHNVATATEDNENQLASSGKVDIGCQRELFKADPELSTATTEVSEDSEMEKPLLKGGNANQELSSSLRKPRPPPVPSLKPAAILWPSAKITPCPPPKPVDRSRKENETPTTNTSSVMESIEKIKMSPKPLFLYMSRTPARDANRCTINSSKASNAKDSSTPLRTPSVAHQAKKSTVTPKSENKRNMTPCESATPGNRTTGAKWRYFGGLDFSMCLSATSRSKSRPSPTASSPFNFRTEERAVKRKEKLELKFDAKAPQKVQLQTKLKEKAECELKKLRQSLCFRARPLPSFYKERKTQKDNTISTNPAEPPRPSNIQQTLCITKDVHNGSNLTPPPPPPPQTQRPYSSQKNKAANTSAAKKRSISKGLTHPRTTIASYCDLQREQLSQSFTSTKMKTGKQQPCSGFR